MSRSGVVSQNRKLIELKNIEKKIAGSLNETGILSEDELRIVGAVSAHRMIKPRYPDETLSLLCYYLYLFERALRDKRWNEIGEEKKLLLKAEHSQNDVSN